MNPSTAHKHFVCKCKQTFFKLILMNPSTARKHFVCKCKQYLFRINSNESMHCKQTFYV